MALHFTESELASDYCSIEALAAHPEVARFIEWIARQPATVDVRVSRRVNVSHVVELMDRH